MSQNWVLQFIWPYCCWSSPAAMMSSWIASMNSSFSAICSSVFLMVLITSRSGNCELSYRNTFRFTSSVFFFLMPRSCNKLKKSFDLMMSSVCCLFFDFTFCW